jgi:hypothetical protein
MMQDDHPHFDVPNIEQLMTGQGASAGKDMQGESSSPASNVLARHHDALMARKGVTMIGEGVDARGKSAIIVGVKKASDLSGLPHEIDGVPVITQVTGKIEAQ